MKIEVEKESGYLYIISNPKMEGWLKIGISQDISNRLHTYQTGDPYRGYKLEYYILHPKYKIAEKKIKESMHYFAKEIKNEWYCVDLNMAKSRLDEQLEEYQNDKNNYDKIISYFK
jgi:hypothetical protein